ncbi:MAG: hypothetical protein QOE58_376, partial [Actinomycetota bacterium]|nr:hypothetical protein [Actinomycetota bacterium]
ARKVLTGLLNDQMDLLKDLQTNGHDNTGLDADSFASSEVSARADR